MEKQIITTLLVMICLVGLSTAYFPGETVEFPNELGITNLVYSVSGNSSPIGDLDIEINSINITITFPQDMTPDTFALVFFEEQVKEVEKIVRRSGGSSTRYVDRVVNQTVYVPEYVDKVIEVPATVNVSDFPVIDIDELGEDEVNPWWTFLGGCAFFAGLAFLFWGFSGGKVKEDEDDVDSDFNNYKEVKS